MSASRAQRLPAGGDAFAIAPRIRVAHNSGVQTLVAAREAMATRFELLLRGDSRTHLAAAAEDALHEIERLEQAWSLFLPASEISFINSRAAQAPVRVSPELFEVLLACQECWQQTGGAFDITVGALMQHWGFRGNSTGPGGLQQVVEHVGSQHLELDRVHRTVRFQREGLQLDLGAVGKGAAVDCAVQVLAAAGVSCALLHAGTSTVRALGTPPGTTGWEVALVNPQAGRHAIRAVDLRGPQAERALLGRVRLRDQALSVSATWGRECQAPGGRSIGHIVDPRTGEPVAHTWMTAVVTPLARDADAWSTALLVGGPAVQQRLHEGRPDLCSLRVVPGPTAGAWSVEARGRWSGDDPGAMSSG